MEHAPTALTRADVEHVARLARLALTDDEIEQLTVELGAVLEHAADVASLDLADVPPTAHPLPLRNVLRDDEIHAFNLVLADEARGAAGAVDARVAAGEDPGPRAGVPIALKDNLCTR